MRSPPARRASGPQDGATARWRRKLDAKARAERDPPQAEWPPADYAAMLGEFLPTDPVVEVAREAKRQYKERQEQVRAAVRAMQDSTAAAIASVAKAQPTFVKLTEQLVALAQAAAGWRELSMEDDRERITLDVRVPAGGAPYRVEQVEAYGNVTMVATKPGDVVLVLRANESIYRGADFAREGLYMPPGVIVRAAQRMVNPEAFSRLSFGGPDAERVLQIDGPPIPGGFYDIPGGFYDRLQAQPRSYNPNPYLDPAGASDMFGRSLFQPQRAARDWRLPQLAVEGLENGATLRLERDAGGYRVALLHVGPRLPLPQEQQLRGMGVGATVGEALEYLQTREAGKLRLPVGTAASRAADACDALLLGNFEVCAWIDFNAPVPPTNWQPSPLAAGWVPPSDWDAPKPPPAVDFTPGARRLALVADPEEERPDVAEVGKRSLERAWLRLDVRRSGNLPPQSWTGGGPWSRAVSLPKMLQEAAVKLGIMQLGGLDWAAY